MSLAICSAVICLVGCGREVLPVPSPTEEAVEGSPELPGAERLFALLRPGSGPLWFEFGETGPVQITSPDKAALTDFVPWPYARHLAGITALGDRLFLAVNREGFLALVPGGGGLLLYRDRAPDWERYTVASVLGWGEIPAALIYGDDFFVQAGGEPPERRFWCMDTLDYRVEALELPALAPASGADGWDIEALRWGRDGYWHYRAVQRNGDRSEIRYFRSPGLDTPGELSSAGLFRDATEPYNNREDCPPLLAELLNAAALPGGKGLLAALVSPDFPAMRYYSAGDNAGDELEEIAAFYRSGDNLAGTLAAILFPNGRGLLDRGDGAVGFSLPALSEGFAYTRLAFSGDVLLAAWEEQQDWNLGAAGFMIITMEEKDAKTGN
jgi:hypothetical protein